MVTEIVLLIVAIVAAIILWKVLKTVKNMVMNTIGGFVVLILADLILKLGIAYTSWIVIAVCAIAGIPGALLIIIAEYTGIYSF
ncbi:pro-sigmaK processing inhibitor BofA family protein [uncultured Methanolobus sp.]|uniref:pro-sigmaK processing inhibitor BofA family protein n=1 Tax=uncultured Methanolobus sp. TaxID=218300 RepID=UPI002AAC2D37|nr:pro-sigmaK processing inhibitor BofA family protein [uncultured Methanolobus sp.]